MVCGVETVVERERIHKCSGGFLSVLSTVESREKVETYPTSVESIRLMTDELLGSLLDDFVLHKRFRSHDDRF